MAAGRNVRFGRPRERIVGLAPSPARGADRDVPTLLAQLPAVSAIAQSIQLSLSPIFMLTAIGALLNVVAGRLSRVVDRTRALEALRDPSLGEAHRRHVAELRLLDRRIRVITWSLTLAVLSAAATCVLVALLFVGGLASLRIGEVVAVAFILDMALLIASLGFFAVEVRLALRAVRVRSDLLR